MTISLPDDGYGFNKLARRMAERKAEALANEPGPLEPDFPYTVVEFPTGFFGAEPSVEGEGV